MMAVTLPCRSGVAPSQHGKDNLQQTEEQSGKAGTNLKLEEKQGSTPLTKLRMPLIV